MKRTILFTSLVLLVGLALTFSQVFAAAPGLPGLKKTPAPDNGYPVFDQGKGPGNSQGNGPGNDQGKGPGNDQGKGPGSSQGKGPVDNPGKGPGNDQGVGNGQDKTPGENAGQGADKNKDKSTKARAENFHGQITSLEGDTLTVALKDGSTRTVTLDEATKIHLAKMGWDGTLADLKDGMRITVHQKQAAGGSWSVDIHVIPTKASLIHVVGTVINYKAGDTSLTVQTQDGPQTFDISNSQMVKGKDADLADGALVTLVRSQDAAGTVKAIVVHPTKKK